MSASVFIGFSLPGLGCTVAELGASGIFFSLKEFFSVPVVSTGANELNIKYIEY